MIIWLKTNSKSERGDRQHYVTRVKILSHRFFFPERPFVYGGAITCGRLLNFISRIFLFLFVNFSLLFLLSSGKLSDDITAEREREDAID